MNLEYMPYVLIVACAVLACGIAIYAARPLARKKRPGAVRHQANGTGNGPGDRAVGARDHKGRGAMAPAPWGWPTGHGATHGGQDKPGNGDAPASPLQRWTDQWVDEKKTTDDAKYRAHREECIRALLEDRFCSQRRATPEDERKEPPQKSNGNGHVPLGDVRTPWGW